ncbi:MAG TPA: hypothetical protein VG167_04390 [Verrucomicrobiae bacterium]|nr:hypothetical protein [Verrucomicrobiae bacterium]
MSRNRKAQSAAARFGPAVKAFLLCLLLGGFGVGYVWQKDQLDKLGQQIKMRENKLDSLKQNNDQLRRNLQTMRNLDYLNGRIRDWKLGLGPAQPNQIWRLTEPAGEPAQPQGPTQLAARSQ